MIEEIFNNKDNILASEETDEITKSKNSFLEDFLSLKNHYRELIHYVLYISEFDSKDINQEIYNEKMQDENFKNDMILIEMKYEKSKIKERFFLIYFSKVSLLKKLKNEYLIIEQIIIKKYEEDFYSLLKEKSLEEDDDQKVFDIFMNCEYTGESDQLNWLVFFSETKTFTLEWGKDNLMKFNLVEMKFKKFITMEQIKELSNAGDLVEIPQGGDFVNNSKNFYYSVPITELFSIKKATGLFNSFIGNDNSNNKNMFEKCEEKLQISYDINDKEIYSYYLSNYRTFDEGIENKNLVII